MLNSFSRGGVFSFQCYLNICQTSSSSQPIVPNQGGVPPKLNCGLFHTFGCDIGLSLCTMLFVQYLRAVIYILSICSVHITQYTFVGAPWYWLKYVWQGVNIVTVDGMDIWTRRLNLSLLCVIPTRVLLSQCVWHYPMWHSPVVLGLAPRSALSAIVSDHNRRIIHNLCLFVVSNGAIRGLLFVLLFQNRAWRVVDHQNVQIDKRGQFATHASLLNAPLHYCRNMSEDNC